MYFHQFNVKPLKTKIILLKTQKTSVINTLPCELLRNSQDKEISA